MALTKAMIFAAGIGSRLRPFTLTHPKALVPFLGKPLLWHCLEYVQSQGIGEVLINVHHFGEQIIAFAEQYRRQHPHFGIYISDERAHLLDTGGGLKKAASFFENDRAAFALINADVVSTIDLRAMYAHHRHCAALVTLAVQQRGASRTLLFDAAQCLVGRENRSSGTREWAVPPPENAAATAFSAWDFSGIHIVEPALLHTATPQQEVFSIIDWYLAAARAGEKIKAFPCPSAFWADVGSPEKLVQAEQQYTLYLQKS